MKKFAGFLLLLLAASFICGASKLNFSLRDERRVLKISQADPVDNAPPLVAFTTVAFGGFRGIVADMLWVRASDLQDEGKYFELVQLADWITKLEPRYAQVWAYHGWNLSYNISVMFNAPEDRWRWVRHGIGLLRDEGLRYNPENSDVLHQLGWIFQHKLGQEFDDAHQYYKEQWAREMMLVLDGPSPDHAALAAAPKTTAELLARPGARELVRSIEATGHDPYALALLGTNVPSAVAKILATDAAVPDLRAYIRRHALIEIYKLDPATMREVDDTYGPLDWRLSQAHAIYWAWLAKKYSRREFTTRQAERMMFQSMVEAFRQGRLFVSPTTGKFLPTANLDLTPRVRKAYDDALAANPNEESYKTPHQNFLRESIETLYTFHRVREAQDLLDDLQKRYPSPENSGTLDAFVFKKFLTDAQTDLSAATSTEAIRLIESFFYQAEIWKLLGDAERSAGMTARALLFHRQFVETHPDPEWWARIGIPTAEELRTSARERAEAEFKNIGL